MPASRSRSRGVETPAPRRRAYWPFIVIGVAALLGVVVAALPASLIGKFLPPQLQAEDFSGSLWHGSAGHLSTLGRDLGAVEWRLHPLALLTLTVSADVHWVKAGFVIDGNAALDRHGVLAHDVRGGGPLEDLSGLGFAGGVHGVATLDLAQLQSDLQSVQSVNGTIDVADLSAQQIAGGAALGGYRLTLQPGSVAPDGTITAAVSDTGGPIDAQAQITFAQASRVAMLTGTLKERSDASPTLQSQLQSLSQLRPRDPRGRIPVDLEFSL